MPRPRSVVLDKSELNKARFWAKVRRQGPNDCWPWIPCLKQPKSRYGYFHVGRKSSGAHRYSLEIKLGRALEEKELACHTCDNPACVNPAHLFVGSDLDNSRDMVTKGRKEVGERVYGAVLTEELVIKAREMYATGKYSLAALDRLFDCSGVALAVRGTTWRHVGGPTDPSRRKTGPPVGWKKIRLTRVQEDMIIEAVKELKNKAAAGRRTGFNSTTVGNVLRRRAPHLFAELCRKYGQRREC